MVRVGLNLLFLTADAQGGLETYARELVGRLGTYDDLQLTAFLSAEGGGSWSDAVEVVRVRVKPSDRKQWVLSEQLILPRLASSHGCEVVHSLASTAPLTGRFTRVTTIHDVNYKIVPDAHSRLRRCAMSVLVPAAARRSHRIIAVSHATAQDLVDHLGIHRSKIDVVPQGVNRLPTVTPTPEVELRVRLDLGDRAVVLSPSAKRPSKNLARLIEAHAQLEQPRPVLILPGYSTRYEEELKTLSGRLGTLSETRYLGWVDAQDHEGLYAMATLVAFPSLYEGFGLPPLEAMARGVPVVTTDRGSLKEVADGAALMVDPESVTSIRNGIARLLRDPAERERLRTAGRARAATFPWERTAALTADVYRRTAALVTH
jgi:glycosyltransferase involved in cell wall biosynthesis